MSFKLDVLETIAETARGNAVLKVRTKEGLVCAAKVFPSKDLAAEAIKEAEIQRHVATAGFAPNVIGVIEIEGKPAILMDLISAPEGPQPKKLTAAKREAFIGLVFTKTDVMHRDNTPANVMYGVTAERPEPQYYLIDFGLVNDMRPKKV